MKFIRMSLQFLQEHPTIAFVSAIYSSFVAISKPDDMLLTVSAWGGALVIILTIIAKCIEIYQKIKYKK
jgi:hypothetical protein